jgi:hypothetical protein
MYITRVGLCLAHIPLFSRGGQDIGAHCKQLCFKVAAEPLILYLLIHKVPGTTRVLRLVLKAETTRGENIG